MNDPSPNDAREPARAPEPCALPRRLLIMIYDFMPALAIVFIAALVALPFTGDRVRAGLHPVYSVYILGAWFLYFGLCWTSSGQTLGMRAWKVEVVDENGHRPNWGTSLIRFGAALLSLAPLGLGYWVSAFRTDKLCWHDRISGTRLQRREPA